VGQGSGNSQILLLQKCHALTECWADFLHQKCC